MKPSSSCQEPDRGRRSEAVRRARGIASAFLVMGLFVVAGCGVTSKKVAGSVTTVVGTAAAAITTTTAAGADTSNHDPGNSDTNGSDTGGQTVGQTWPKVAQDAFVRSCTASAAVDVCKCAMRALEPVLSFDDLASIGSGASNVSKFQSQITKATRDCVANPNSH
jgi:hypothetical protein